MAGWQFWLAAAALVAACGWLLLRPRRAREDTSPGAAALYRAQLADIDRDLARGTLQDADAARLRLDIARRLLEAGKAQPLPDDTQDMRGLMGGLIALALGLSFAGYQWLGVPQYPDLPLAARIAAAEELRATRPSQSSVEAQITQPAPLTPDAGFSDLMNRLRSAVASRPDNVTGLALLAQNEASLGNFAAARDAQQALIAAKGAAATAQDHADLAEMMMALAGGYVSPEAEEVLTTALTLDPDNATARYYAGLMMGQVGRYDLGFRMWRPLADAPDTARWMAAFRAQMPDMAARAGVAFQLPEPRGPSAADIAAADTMTPQDRATMISGMVNQLSERLATAGGPPEDWAKLISALLVTGDTARAEMIRTEALQVFAGNAAALATVRAAAAP